MSTMARTDTGDLAIPRVVVTDFASCVLQSVIDGLGLWQGEWFLDQNQGFPWLQKILGRKNPSPTTLGKYIRDFLLSVPGIIRVTATAKFDGSKRAFAYSFVANLNNGQTLTRSAAGAYNVSGSP